MILCPTTESVRFQVGSDNNVPGNSIKSLTHKPNPAECRRLNARHRFCDSNINEIPQSFVSVMAHRLCANVIAFFGIWFMEEF